jgi:hypothetical protein
VCDGSSITCPPDAKKSVGEACDDGDPETGTSSCTASQECRGVTTTVSVQTEIQVPPNESPKQVKIPVTLEVPDTPGTKAATAVLQGFVDCVEIPPAQRPQKCGQPAGAVTAGYGARLESVFLRVTPKVKRSLGRSQSRSATSDLPLTKLGQKLFAKLAATPAGLPVHVQSTLRDRKGRKAKVDLPTTLKLQH